ncbi:2-phospho-L-lactate guanylyltransferase [Microbacterium oxydans]|uniref:2-phospho-L-lactate guanylyltransferase n=1 Tax=Microbacterium sp. B19(2022) TaxID=2914045 RepID=UPI00143199ED|nr:2-phospho-L-lactate guanylyltransferase [Microbacterium sp. B19(2022)]NJI58421.1 2-phospho-L-lactate guanylyltransferase [Microbacterium sp. B19(2022)]
MIRGSGIGVPLPGAPAREWVVVIPVKRAEIGKSRLRIPGVDREPLARAIALDTVEAAAACERVAQVIVVTRDEVTATALRLLPRVRLVRDRSEGLTAAIEQGVRAAPGDRPRAVLLGDLPALRPDELARALAFASSHPRAFVPDAEGTGTVLATARAGFDLRTCFGGDSAAAHRAAGFAEVGLPVLSGLRRDLDRAEHLRDARRAGLGPRTSALVDRPLVLAS